MQIQLHSLSLPLALALVTACSAEPITGASTAEERGEIQFGARRCGNCHGPDGNGISLFPGGPSVVGRSAADIRAQLTVPCEDTGQTSNCHPLKIYDLADAQIADIAAYLQTLGGGFDADNPGPVCDDTPGNICTVVGNGISGNRNQPSLLGRVQNLFWPQNVGFDPEGRVIVTDWNNYIFRRLETETTAECREVTDEFGNMGRDCPITRVVAQGDLGDTCSTPDNRVLAVNANMNHSVGELYDDLIPGRSGLVIWGWHQWKIKYVPIDPVTGEYQEMWCLFGNARGAGDEGVPAGYNFDGNLGPTRFNLPSSAVYDAQRNWYISDQGNLRIRKISSDSNDDYTDPERMVTSLGDNLINTFAGGLKDATGAFRKTLPDYGDSGDGGPALEATFNLQAGFDAVPQFRLAIDKVGNRLFVADSENDRIRVIDLTTNIINTYVGGGQDVQGTNVDPRTVQLRSPADVDFNADGSLLVTDTFNHCIRLVDPTGTRIVTVAGVCGSAGDLYAGDGGTAVDALLQEPGGAALAPDGTVYVADTLAHRVRRVNPPLSGSYFQ